MMLVRMLMLSAAITLLAMPTMAQEIGTDPTKLPKRVQATRNALLAAARAADIAGLQAIIDKQGNAIQLGFGGAETAADFATANSLSGDGLDVLAELIDVLEMPYEEFGDAEGGAYYIWPYLAGLDMGSLSDTDKVAAYQLISPDSLPDFVEYGGWLAMRTIIDADGRWSAWVLGD